MSHAAEEWMLDGLCRFHPDPDIFTADPNRISEIHLVVEAKRVCNIPCPVKSQCLDWAMRTQEPYAIAGGLDHEERRAIRRRETRRRRQLAA